MYERDGDVYSAIPNDFPIEDFLSAARRHPEEVALHYLNEFYAAFDALRHRDTSWELDTEHPICHILAKPGWRDAYNKPPTFMEFLCRVTS
jgi:hypothetical protein